jgi:hypothetical protein
VQAAFKPRIVPPLGLLNLDEETKKAPETRLQNGHDARRLLWSCLQEDQERSRERALTKGLVDGNPPYNDARRRAEGRGWECNLNFMEGLSIMDSSAVPYYSLFANVPAYAECHTAYQSDNPDHEQWSAAITLRFHNLLKRWQDFDWHVQQISYWMRLHGIGIAFFDKESDWRFRSIETGHLLVPRGAPSSIDKRLPFTIIRMAYRITELYQWIKEEKYAGESGVNVQAVKNAIMFGMKGLAPSGSNWYAQPWEYWERILKNNDLTASFTDSDVVNCAWILVQEFSGKISKFLFTEHEVVTNDKPQKGDDKQFLFSDPNCYDDFQEGLVVFFQDTADGTFHSVRGLAMKAFKHLEVSNRLKCQTVNRAFIDSSLVIKSGTARNKDKIGLTVFGSVIRLPAGAEFESTSVQGGTQGVMEVDRMLTNHLANNIGMFNQRTLSREDGKGEMPTASQVNQQVAKESTLSSGQITLFYGYLDALYQQIFKRAADPTTSDEEAKRFQKECASDNVPKQALANMEFVRANRQSGYGSPQMGLLKMQQGQQIVPMLPEQGKQNWLEDSVTLIYGPEKTARYAPRQHVPDDQDWQASVENDMIHNGRQPVVSSGQDDVIHLTSHFADADETLRPVHEALQQGQKDQGQLVAALQYVQTGAPHWEEHINRLEGDSSRKAQGKLFREQFTHAVSFSGKLYGAVRDAMREAQIQQDQASQTTALSALDAAKVQSVQTGTQLAAMKVKSQIENQAAKTAASLQQKAVTHAVNTRINVAKAATHIQTKKAKAVPAPAELTAA